MQAPFWPVQIPHHVVWSPAQDPAFRAAVAQRFLALRAGTWSDASVGALIDGNAAALRPAGLRTLTKCGLTGFSILLVSTSQVPTADVPPGAEQPVATGCFNGP